MARGRSLVSRQSARELVAPLIPLNLAEEFVDPREGDSVEIVLCGGDRICVRGRLAATVTRRIVRLLEADR